MARLPRGNNLFFKLADWLLTIARMGFKLLPWARVFYHMVIIIHAFLINSAISKSKKPRT